MNPQNKFPALEPECKSWLEELYNELIEFRNLDDALLSTHNTNSPYVGYPYFLNSLSKTSQKKIFGAYAFHMESVLTELRTEHFQKIAELIHKLSQTEQIKQYWKGGVK